MRARIRLNSCIGLGLMLLALVSLNTQASQTRPHIMTSLHPLAFIAAEVAGDQAEIDVLVPAGASPHTYSMRPSERRRLEQADHFLWVGPGMETFLERLVHQPAIRDKSFALGESLAHSDHEHNHHDHDADHPHHDEVIRSSVAEGDPHIWLNPALALTMAERLVAHLADSPDFEQDRLEANLAQFRTDLDETVNRLNRELEPARSLSIFTYHDAFRHFAEFFELNLAGNLTINPERNPGARQLSELREHLREASSPCVMTEPQFSRNWWDNLADDLVLGVSNWDPLGQSIEPDPGSYLRFMESLSEAVGDCLRN